MSSTHSSSGSIIYREYIFSEDFPFSIMCGDSVCPRLEFIHFHNYLEIAVCEKGSMTWNVENKSSMLFPEQICFIPPFLTHASCFLPQDEDVLCYYIFFDAEKMLRFVYPNGIPAELFWYRYADFNKIVSRADSPLIWQTLQQIIHIFFEKGKEAHSVICGLVQLLMIYLYRYFEKTDMPSSKQSTLLSRLFPAVSYLNHQSALEECHVEHLAQLCGLSSSKFTEMFQKCFHKTPHGYLRELRIDNACRYLISTEKTILEISLLCGFQSLSSFNRNFRAVTKTTPTAFRLSHRTLVKKETLLRPRAE